MKFVFMRLVYFIKKKKTQKNGDISLIHVRSRFFEVFDSNFKQNVMTHTKLSMNFKKNHISTLVCAL